MQKKPSKPIKLLQKWTKKNRKRIYLQGLPKATFVDYLEAFPKPSNNKIFQSGMIRK
jgi:hypothetical protein